MTAKIDVFNATAATIFDELWGTFPHGKSMYVHEVTELVRTHLGDPSVSKADVAASLNWLSLNNFVIWERHTLRDDSVGARYSLSDKALLGLRRLPSSLGGDISERVKAIGKETVKEVARQSLGTLVGEVIGGALKSVLS